VSGLRVGIDLGGTKIEAIGMEDDGEEAARHRVATPRSYEGTLDAIAGLVSRVETEAGGTGPVGVGIPGTISPRTGLVKNANSVWLIGHAFDKDLEERLQRPVRLMNDANCFALSEAADGAARGAEVVFGVILGTGVGGGIVVRGRPLQGTQLVAGEWGHNPLPWPRDDERPGPRCYCGQDGCIETFVSGPGMARDHEKVTGKHLTTREIIAGAEKKDPEARATVERYVERLARGLATVINILDPDVIVLGGGMSNMPDLAVATLAALPPWVFSDSVATRVVKNMHGDSSGVRGAAWLWDVGEAG
jgi:fructokinase